MTPAEGLHFAVLGNVREKERARGGRYERGRGERGWAGGGGEEAAAAAEEERRGEERRGEVPYRATRDSSDGCSFALLLAAYEELG
eukprot:632945-Hanusia_phi.AAC.1